jgi:elongation factor P
MLEIFYVLTGVIMISTSDFRKGMKIAIDNEPYVIVDFQNARTAQRRANVWTKLKHIQTGQVIERSFSSGLTFNEPDFDDRAMQYLYNDSETWNFMDNETFDQVTLTKEQIGDYRWYLLENSEYKILFFNGIPISIDLPASMILKVEECEPGIKGDRVSNVLKNATLETGLVVKVPLFVKDGDSIKVDTREGKYLERM